MTEIARGEGMKLSEEYRLSQYEELKTIHGRSNISIVRNKINGIIAVKKIVPIELKEIYAFLKNHPNPFVPIIYENIEDEQNLTIIEEYLTGQNLEEILIERTIPEEEAVFITLQLCLGLKPLHNANPPIICRDLKASNIMITMDKKVKIVDFDIARIYQTGQRCDTRLMGTREYAAPEQYGFMQTDSRTDIYALGVLLNYMILKKFPIEEIVSGKLREIICKCLEMNPNDRYQSIEELETKLRFLYQDNTTEKYNNSQTYFIKNKNLKYNSYRIPGFRSLTWWKILCAILGYSFITMMAFSMEFTSHGVKLAGIQLRFEQSIFWLTQIASIFLIYNYRGISNPLPLVHNPKRSIRIIGYIIIAVIMQFVGVSFLVMFESFIF